MTCYLTPKKRRLKYFPSKPPQTLHTFKTVSVKFVHGNDIFRVIVLDFQKVAEFTFQGFFFVDGQRCLYVNPLAVFLGNEVDFLIA